MFKTARKPLFSKVFDNRTMYKTNLIIVQNNTLLNIVTFVHKPSTDYLPEVLHIRTKNVQIRRWTYR